MPKSYWRECKWGEACRRESKEGEELDGGWLGFGSRDACRNSRWMS